LLRSQKKLSWVEEQKLCSSFELHIFSRVYAQLKADFDSVSTPSTLLNRAVSRSIKFFQAFTVEFIKEVATIGQKHEVRLLRHIVQVLRSALEKLGEDQQRLDSYCTAEECGLSKSLNHDDRLTILGLIKFIIHQAPFGEQDLVKGIHSFLVANEGDIQQALNEFKS
jgi:hypothetical protein